MQVDHTTALVSGKPDNTGASPGWLKLASPSRLEDEPARLAALERYEVLDTPPEGPFDKITALIQSILHVPIATVSLIDGERQWLKSQRGLDVRETARDISFCTHTIRKSTPMIVADAQQDPRFSGNPLVTGAPHIRSYAGVPLETPDGYNVGALCAIDTVPREFDPGQMEILERFAGLVVEELELRRIAQRDHLTGALTRRAFIAEADKEIARFERYQRPCAIVLMDIDHFKAINDSWGHPIGDQVLRAVASCVMATMRPSDSFGRIGGEEFALVLPETELDDAMIAADRFRQALNDLVIKHAPPLRITASFGVAPLTTAFAAGEQWLAMADRGLYAAKRGGRDRVCLAVADPALEAA